MRPAIERARRLLEQVRTVARRDGARGVVAAGARKLRGRLERTRAPQHDAVVDPVRTTPAPSLIETVATATEVLQGLHAGLAEAPDLGPTPPVIDALVSDEITVVVPAFQAADHLADCLESVRRQTHPRWQCLVVDDASTDATAAVVSAMCRRDERFTLLRHGANRGLSAARNTGLAAAETPLVTFLDADDLLVRTSLERRVEALRSQATVDVAGSWGSTPLVPVETTIADADELDRPHRDVEVHATSHAGECPFNAHAPLLWTELLRGLGGFDESLLAGAEDWDLWHRLLRHGYRLVNAGGRAGVYRQRPGSMVRRDTSGHLDAADRLLRMARQHVDTDPTLVVDPAAARGLADIDLAAARCRRVALYLGIELGASGSWDAVDDRLLSRLDAVPLASVPGLDLVERVTAGLHRGLGLGTAKHDLDVDTVRRVDEVAGRAAAMIEARLRSLAAAWSPDATTASVRPVRDERSVLLLAETAADVAALRTLLVELQDAETSVAAVDLDRMKGDEGSVAAWSDAGVDLVSYAEVWFGRVRTGAVVAHRPIGPASAELVELLRSRGAEIVEWSDGLDGTRLGCNEGEAVEMTAAFPARPNIGSTPARPLPDRFARLGTALPIEEGTLLEASAARLADLRGAYDGETCVIVGNGPSLNDTDLGQLAGVPTFGVNAIFLASERFVDPITFYVVEDTSVFRENTDEIKAFETTYKFFPSNYRSSFDDAELDDTISFFRMNAGFYGRDTGTLCHPRFSLDAVQRLFCGQSVTIINLQLAHWMGFHRVVLIGMDFSYTIPEDVDRKGDVLTSNSDDVNHFHKDYFGVGKTWKDPKLDRVLANYHLAGHMFRSTGREIVNSTVGGRLEIFPRLDLADAVNGAPV
ncbi:MAG: glycosyltransferase [Actinomycetota bacterium]